MGEKYKSIVYLLEFCVHYQELRKDVKIIERVQNVHGNNTILGF